MEDRSTTVASSAGQWFQCPGQTRSIERAVHLARLAAFDPACLACSHRHDTAGLTRLDMAARAEVERRASAGWQWTGTAAVTSARGRMDPQFPRRFALALAEAHWSAARQRPALHVAADGSQQALELMAELGHVLELAGCDAGEVGEVTVPCLAMGISNARASGGVWIGNASGRPHELALLVIEREGCPWSESGRLVEIRSRLAAGVVRPRRSGGTLRRFDAAAGYLPPFLPAFHGLRPLEFVLHTANRSLAGYLATLCRETALRITRLDSLRLRNATTEADPLQAELAAVACETVLQGAHFGLWIDGAGQRCELVDERGQSVAHDRLTRLLACAITHPGSELSPAMRAQSVDTRDSSISQAQISLAADPLPSDRVRGDGLGNHWFAEHPAPDALAVLCALLALLSRSDRPLSEVLDAAAPAR